MAIYRANHIIAIDNFWNNKDIIQYFQGDNVWIGNKETTDISDLPKRVEIVHLEFCDDVRVFPSFIANERRMLLIFYSNETVYKNIINWPNFRVVNNGELFDGYAHSVTVEYVPDNEVFIDNL